MLGAYTQQFGRPHAGDFVNYAVSHASVHITKRAPTINVVPLFLKLHRPILYGIVKSDFTSNFTGFPGYEPPWVQLCSVH